jgi:AraC-like DNA-binding protein
MAAVPASVVERCIDAVMDRRHVDWSTFLGPDAPVPTLVKEPVEFELRSVLSAFDELLALDDTDAILRRSVEIARERIGLCRVALFLYDEPRGLMLGTWGTDLEGATVDEHAIMYDIGRNDLEVFRRAAEDGVYFSVFENAPLVVQLPDETRVVGNGWVCCTPIRSARGPLGMMFNDAGKSGAPVDEAKQARAAVLCSLLGTVLDLARKKPGGPAEPPRVSARAPLIVKAVQLLANDPSMTGATLGKTLALSASRLARVFKAEMGMSLVEYRNRLRLERFSVLLDKTGDNILAAALQAGFGSYAQFHRVFSALRGTTPRKYLRSRVEPARQK